MTALIYEAFLGSVRHDPFAGSEDPFGIGSRLPQADLPTRERLPPCIGIHHPTDCLLLRPSSDSNRHMSVREY